MVKLPVRFNPSRLLSDDKLYVAEIPVGQFSRFADALSSKEGEVRAEMRFFLDDDNRTCVSGHFRVSCELQCQRCMQGFRQALDADFSLVFVASEAAAEQLPEELDPVILDEHGHIHSVDLLEDELILQLPVSARHEELRTCIDLGFNADLMEDEDGSLEGEDSGRDQARKNPFDILKNFTKTD